MLGGRTELSGTDLLLGVAAGLVGGASYAYYAVISARIIAAGDHQPREVMGALFGLGALPLVPVVAIFVPALLSAPINGVVLGYLTIGPVVGAYLLFGAGLVSVSGSAATLITLIEPVVAAVLAVSVVGERMSTFGWLGIALILSAVLLAAAPAGRRGYPQAAERHLSRG